MPDFHVSEFNGECPESNIEEVKVPEVDLKDLVSSGEDIIDDESMDSDMDDDSDDYGRPSRRKSRRSRK